MKACELDQIKNGLDLVNLISLLHSLNSSHMGCRRLNSHMAVLEYRAHILIGDNASKGYCSLNYQTAY